MVDYSQVPDKTLYLYGTCVVDLFFPDAGMDALEVLEKLGLKVVFLQEQSCCGQPAYTSGYENEARSVAASQLKLFTQPWPLVILSGSCGGMIKHHYPKLFAGTPQERQANELAERTFEFSEFLIDVLQVSAEDLGLRGDIKDHIVLHTSCSARREMGTLASGRKLVDTVAPDQRVTQDYESECCGFGGTFSVRWGELAGEMVTDKANHIKATDAKRLVSADCACLLNINGALKKQKAGIQGEHLASFVNAAMKPSASNKKEGV